MSKAKKLLERVILRIENARLAYSNKQVVKLLAVSKYHTSDEILDLYNAGQRAFGENKVQDLSIKIKELESIPIEWHFIGTLQSNKINTLLAIKPSLIHSLDSIKLAKELDSRLKKQNLTQDALLQINVSKEESKHGVSLESSLDTYFEIKENFKNINLKGLMTIGANTDDIKIIDSNFNAMYKVYEKLPNASILSMGMSNDFEIAIKNGANLIRLGSVLF